MQKKKLVRKKGQCYFCQNKIKPDFVDFETLKRFISERGKILSQYRTGTCAAHQRQLKKAIKRARFLSLLPFAAKI